MSNRLIRKYFQCDRCKEVESQMIHPNQFQTKCSKCGAFLNEIPEKEYRFIEKNIKNKKEDFKLNDDMPYRPPENAFINASSVYNRPSSRNNINENENRNRFNYINNRQQRRRKRYHSNNHYTDMNIVNDNMDDNIEYNNNINNENYNNEEFERRNNRQMENNNETDERERNYQRWPRFRNGSRIRGRSSNPMDSSFSDNFFNNFFGVPFMPFGIMTHPIIFSHDESEQPYRIFVQRQYVPQFLFDPIFLTFGSMFNDNFINNYSSNFRSNFRGDFLNEILRILERNQDEAARRAHPPTSETALKKLKKFPLTDKYCKKDKNGKIELPSCCICLNDVQKNEETVLLPCGHMFHWDCCLKWLKNNNTCPMCRFEIKD